jgi:RNA 3'-terminal phosphate cyclase (ATP)
MGRHSKGHKTKKPEVPVDEEPDGLAGTIHLDGRTLEGGGQLVRNALALSALTAKPITITHIRGNRQGKTGLKGSHAAAVKFLTDTCGGEVIGGEIGSTTLTFYPRGRSSDGTSGEEDRSSLESDHPWSGQPPIRPEYHIRQSTAGSIFLIFQALYPYLLHASSVGSVGPVRLNITGGTNVSCSPSYDYVKQVLVPNLRRLGFPQLSVDLHERGWSTGPMDLGAVMFLVHSLGSHSTEAQPDGSKEPDGSGINQKQNKEADGEDAAASEPRFPPVNLSHYKRGAITQVDITILAPDTSVGGQESQDRKREGKKEGKSRGSRSHESSRTAGYHTGEPDEWKPLESMTMREYLEEKMYSTVARALRRLPESVIPKRSNSDDSQAEDHSSYRDGDISVPIRMHTSEATHHHTHLYILLVAHTSNGFKLGRDALFEGFKGRGRKTKGRHENYDGSGDSTRTTLDELVERCVARFVEELQPDDLPDEKKHKPCVDVFMRDQLVIFEGLGKEQNREKRAQKLREVDGDVDEGEDERFWSLHTRTARWVCEKILGEGIWA